jgi:hypothetical protein
MFNENNGGFCKPWLKENCSPSASDTDEDAIIENDDGASASEIPSGTSFCALSKQKKKTSLIWDYFKMIVLDKMHAFCTLCSQKVNYGSLTPLACWNGLCKEGT